jgi:hypothetical protein
MCMYVCMYVCSTDLLSDVHGAHFVRHGRKPLLLLLLLLFSLFLHFSGTCFEKQQASSDFNCIQTYASGAASCIKMYTLGVAVLWWEGQHINSSFNCIKNSQFWYWGLQNNWESSNGFQRFFSSKLVPKSVENRCSIPNYFANRSTALLNCWMHVHHLSCGLRALSWNACLSFLCSHKIR